MTANGSLGHPQRDGLFVSAGSMEVWRKDGLGRIRHARRDHDKLVMEAWIDLVKVDELGEDAADLVDALQDGQPVDVSVGAFIDSEPRPGRHQGKVYARTQSGYVPDHVAFLPGQEGACSWADGCGAPRTHQSIEANLMTLQSAPTTPGDGGEEAIIPLATSGSSCSCGGADGCCTCAQDDEDVSLLAGKLQFKAQTIGDRARRALLGTALKEKMPNRWNAIVEVFDADVVYESDGGTFSRSYSIGDDGTVTLSDDPVQGALVAEFMPITVQQEHAMSERKKAVDGLIANTAAPWSEDDRTFLMAAPDDQFAKLTANHQPKSPGPTTPPNNPPNEGTSGKDDTFPQVEIDPEPVPGEPQTAEPFLAAAPAEVREILAEGMAERRRSRNDLITRIKANQANQFTDADLEAMANDQLRKLAALSFSEASAGRPAGGNYAGAQPAVSTAQEIKMYADQPGEPDWSRRAH